MTEQHFRSSSAVSERFPAVCAEVVAVTGFRNDQASNGLSDIARAVQAEVVAWLAETASPRSARPAPDPP